MAKNKTPREQVRALIDAHGTMTKAAEDANVSRADLSAWLCGRKKTITVETLEKLATALDKPIVVNPKK